jgi:hypothetical protein
VDSTVRHYQRELERSGQNVLVIPREELKTGYVVVKEDGSIIYGTISRDEVSCRQRVGP